MGKEVGANPALAVPAKPVNGLDASRCDPGEWQPIATLPLGQRALLGSYYDSFPLRPPFAPIWQIAEGHSYEFNGGTDFSFSGSLQQRPTHWRPLLNPPPYVPSAEQVALAQAIEARRAETGTGSVHDSAAIAQPLVSPPSDKEQ